MSIWIYSARLIGRLVLKDKQQQMLKSGYIALSKPTTTSLSLSEVGGIYPSMTPYNGQDKAGFVASDSSRIVYIDDVVAFKDYNGNWYDTGLMAVSDFAPFVLHGKTYSINGNDVVFDAEKGGFIEDAKDKGESISIDSTALANIDESAVIKEVVSCNLCNTRCMVVDDGRFINVICGMENCDNNYQYDSIRLDLMQEFKPDLETLLDLMSVRDVVLYRQLIEFGEQNRFDKRNSIMAEKVLVDLVRHVPLF